MPLLPLMDAIGTIAFAVSGAMLGARKKMDIFGINLMALVTATGGGLLRDVIIGCTPPMMFRDPRYVMLAVITANTVFVLLRPHRPLSRRVHTVYEQLLLLFDTLGLAAFTADGVLAGVRAGYAENLFLIVFLGTVTGVGGGMLRDILAGRTPDVLVKHVYAVAAMTGALVSGVAVRLVTQNGAALLGAAAVVLIRFLSAHYRWNLPRIESESRDSRHETHGGNV